MNRRPHILGWLLLVTIGFYFFGASQLRSLASEAEVVHSHLASYADDSTSDRHDDHPHEEQSSHTHHHQHRHSPDGPVHEHSHPHVPALENTHVHLILPAQNSLFILADNQLPSPSSPRLLHSTSILDSIFRPPISHA